MQKQTALLLFILFLFSSEIFCQTLYLKINGSNEAATQTIDSLNYIKTHQDFSSISSEVAFIQSALFKQGYIEHEADEISKINDSTFSTSIRLKRKFNTIHIYYDSAIIDKSLLNHISTSVFDSYFELPFTEVASALTYINSKISENGFPFSKLKLSNIAIEDETYLSAKLYIDTPEQKRYISDIIIKGYEKFPRSYLKHYLKIKKGQVFDLNTIKTKTEQLNDLNFASQIKSPEVLFTKDSTALYLYLEKQQSNSFDGFLGFGTNEDTNAIEFDGYLNLSLNNNLNFGESFRLLYKSDENDQKTFDANITLPYLFKTPIGADFQLRIFKRDSSFTTVNQSAKLHYQINSKHKVYAGLTYLESNNLLSETSTFNIQDYKTSFYTFAYQYIRPQTTNQLFPINSNLYFESNFGNRKQTNTSQKQSQLSIDAFKIINLNQKNSFYTRINGAVLTSDDYLENELSRFGGINSIRGFEENSLYASLYGLVNTEYRYQLSNSIYIHSITDIAYFENKILKTKEKLYGYGFGFGLLTKAGLFKLNYANGKLQNEKFELSNSKIHISLTTDF
ncbi:POTRA domain-containing protein [Algibacter miyuki]|uniref:POTRA domain-containing protein n=1 Tax=Algibacter miyuki TaxID=1306933 RepID=A0ABV5H128_9FLAO|nr:POTRA domain-containing protein [Algibacter miyuki]MDN3666222.1 POTRA domain-containing protein [Algibacter miyuki]